MEVHAHSHTARIKWTHYFCEFLMLFIAVFCGFLAEKKRKARTHNSEVLRQRGVTNKTSSSVILSAAYPADGTPMSCRIYSQLL